MAEGIRILTAAQADLAKTALVMLAMRAGGESREVSGVMAALRTEVPDPQVEVARLRAFVDTVRRVPYSHLIFVPDGYDVLEALAALKEVPADAQG